MTATQIRTTPGTVVSATGAVAASVSESDSSHGLCTFRLAGHWFGIDVLTIQEVLRPQDTTSVPLAPSFVVGLMNLRGQIVTTVDLRQLLGLEPAEAGAASMNVVVRTADGPLSLLVDSIGEVIDVDSTSFEAPPATLSGAARGLITGAYKLDAQLVLELDITRVLDALALAGK